MIEKIVLTNSGVSFLLSYFDDGIEKMIPEIPQDVFNTVQDLIVYVERKKTTEEENIQMLEQEKEALELNIDKYKSVLLQKDLTKEEMLELIDIYPEWDDNSVDYVVGDKVKWQDSLYEVLQPHTSQSDWTPDVSVSLFTKIVPDGVIGEWVQPTGGHNAYNTGDQVTFNGEVYQSTVDANIWSPTDYPQGWQLI